MELRTVHICLEVASFKKAMEFYRHCFRPLVSSKPGAIPPRTAGSRTAPSPSLLRNQIHDA